MKRRDGGIVAVARFVGVTASSVKALSTRGSIVARSARRCDASFHGTEEIIRGGVIRSLAKKIDFWSVTNRIRDLCVIGNLTSQRKLWPRNKKIRTVFPAFGYLRNTAPCQYASRLGQVGLAGSSTGMIFSLIFPPENVVKNGFVVGIGAWGEAHHWPPIHCF